MPGTSVPGGSSPHTRGLRLPTQNGMFSTGIIPAHAGFTYSLSLSLSSSSDHPRTRGVYGGVGVCPRLGWGSSPHTRGLR